VLARTLGRRQSIKESSHSPKKVAPTARPAKSGPFSRLLHEAKSAQAPTRPAIDLSGENADVDAFDLDSAPFVVMESSDTPAPRNRRNATPSSCDRVGTERHILSALLAKGPMR
jgi:hypothetical protein